MSIEFSPTISSLISSPDLSFYITLTNSHARQLTLHTHSNSQAISRVVHILRFRMCAAGTRERESIAQIHYAPTPIASASHARDVSLDLLCALLHLLSLLLITSEALLLDEDPARHEHSGDHHRDALPQEHAVGDGDSLLEREPAHHEAAQVIANSFDRRP